MTALPGWPVAGPSRSSREQSTSALVRGMSFSTDYATREQPLRLRIATTMGYGSPGAPPRRQFLLPCVPSAPIASLKARIASILGGFGGSDRELRTEDITLLLQGYEIVDDGVVGDVLRDDDIVE